MEEGEGEQPSIRYAFDAENRKCTAFMYKGKGGNTNSFLNAQLCMNFCSAAACAPGEIIYKPRAEDEPFDCSNEACPHGFICVVDLTNLARSICCGSINLGSGKFLKNVLRLFRRMS